MRTWVKILLALLIAALLAGLAFALLQGIAQIVGNVELGKGEPDPMFSTPPELVTRPPELDEEEVQREHPTLDDYTPVVESPVDKTAEELIAEAKLAENK